MSFLKNLQNQPKHIRTAILWIIMIIIGAGFIYLWFGILSSSLQRVVDNEVIDQALNLPKLEEEMQALFPKLPEEKEVFKCETKQDCIDIGECNEDLECECMTNGCFIGDCGKELDCICSDDHCFAEYISDIEELNEK